MKTGICIALLSFSTAAAAADRPIINVTFDIQADHPYRGEYKNNELTKIRQSVLRCFTTALQERFPLYHFVDAGTPDNAHQLALTLGDEQGVSPQGLVRPVGFTITLDPDQQPDADYVWLRYRRGEDFVAPLPAEPVFARELSKLLASYVRSSSPEIVSKLLQRVSIAHGFHPPQVKFFYLEWKNEELGLASDSQLKIEANGAQDEFCRLNAELDGVAPASDEIPTDYRGGARVKAVGPAEELPRLSNERITPKFVYVTRYSRITAIEAAPASTQNGVCP